MGRLQKGAGTSWVENPERNPTVRLRFQVRVFKGGTSVANAGRKEADTVGE